MARVTNNNQSAQQAGRNLGLNLNAFGNLTDQQVRDSSLAAKQAKEQVRKAEIYSKNLALIMECQQIIEKLALEAMKLGLKTDAQIQKFISDGTLASAQYQANLQKLGHTEKLALQSIQAELLKDKSLDSFEHQGRLQALAAKYGVQRQIIGSRVAGQIQAAREQPKLAAQAQKEAQAKESYWRGESSSPSPKGGGLLQSIANFFRI